MQYTEEQLAGLDRMSLEDLVTRSSSLPPSLSSRVLTADRAIASGYKWENVIHGSYVKNAPLISLSSWKHADRVIRCGIPGSDGRRHYCGKVRVCCFCAWRQGQNLLTRLSPLHSRQPHWTHVTVTYTSNVSIRSSSSVYRERINRAVSCLQTLIDRGVITGAVSSADVSIPSLEAGQVFPHLHALVCSSDSITGEDGKLLDSLQPVIDELNHDGQIRFSFHRIATATDFKYCVRYLVKAIDLRRVYGADLLTSSPLRINSGLDRTLTWLTNAEYRFLKIRHLGCLSPRRLDYCGRPAQRRVAPARTRRYNASVNMQPAVTAPQPKKKSLLSRFAPVLGAGAAVLGGGYAAHKGLLGQTAQRFVHSITNPQPSVRDAASAYNYAGQVSGRSTGLRNELQTNLQNQAKSQNQNPYLASVRDHLQFPGASLANDVKDTVTRDTTPVHPWLGVGSEAAFGLGVGAVGSGIDRLAASKGLPVPGAARMFGRGLAGLGVVGDVLDFAAPNRNTGMAALLDQVGDNGDNAMRMHQSIPLLASDAAALVSRHPLAAIGANIGTAAVDAKAGELAAQLSGLDTQSQVMNNAGEHLLQLYRASKSSNPDVANRAMQLLRGFKRSGLGMDVMDTPDAPDQSSGLAARMFRLLNPVENTVNNLSYPAARRILSGVR